MDRQQQLRLVVSPVEILQEQDEIDLSKHVARGVKQEKDGIISPRRYLQEKTISINNHNHDQSKL